MEKEIFIYYGAILLASCFAGLAQKFSKKDENNNIIKLNKIWWIASILIVLLLIGFRTCGVGVDDYTYLRIFKSTAKNGIISQFLNSNMEPGYLALNYIISLFTNNFQVVIFITTLVPLILYYKALEYEKNHINLFVGVFLFGTILLLYFCGITRLFIAASICAFAIKYIIEKKPAKYALAIIIATMFHCSAIIMLFFIIIAVEKEKKPISIKKMSMLLLVGIPIIIIIVFVYIFPNSENRYSGYTIQDFNLRIGIDKIIILIASLLLYKLIKIQNKSIRVYIILYTLATIVSIYSAWFNIGRMQWYSMFAICVILPSISRIFNQLKNEELNLFVIPTIIAYGILYSYKIVFIQSTNECMRTYSNIVFK